MYFLQVSALTVKKPVAAEAQAEPISVTYPRATTLLPLP